MNKEITSPKCCHEICYFPVIGVTGPTGATGPIGPARKCNAISVSLVNSRSSTVYPSETIVFDTLINKTNNNIVYDFESGEFTFLSSGYYIVYFTLNVNPSTLAVDFKINFTLNNSQIITAAGAGSNSATACTACASWAVSVAFRCAPRVNTTRLAPRTRPPAFRQRWAWPWPPAKKAKTATPLP